MFPSVAYQKPFHVGFLLTLVSEIMFIFQIFFDSEDLLGINEENDLTGVKGVSNEELPRIGLITVYENNGEGLSSVIKSLGT